MLECGCFGFCYACEIGEHCGRWSCDASGHVDPCDDELASLGMLVDLRPGLVMA